VQHRAVSPSLQRVVLIDLHCKQTWRGSLNPVGGHEPQPHWRQDAQADSRPAAPGKCSAARGKLKILSLSTAFETADVDKSV
jgi:hypothetical protein